MVNSKLKVILLYQMIKIQWNSTFFELCIVIYLSNKNQKMHTLFINVSSMAGCDQTAYMDAWKIYYKTACTSLPEDEHLDVRNISKAPELNYKFDEKSGNFVASYYINTVERFKFHLVRSAQCLLSQATNMTVNFTHVRFYSVQPRDPLFPIEAMNSDFTLLPYRETSWSWDKALGFCADLEFEAKYHLLLPPTVKTCVCLCIYVYIGNIRPPHWIRSHIKSWVPLPSNISTISHHRAQNANRWKTVFPCFKICILTSCQTPLSVPQDIVDTYSTIPWVMWEAVTVVDEGCYDTGWLTGL
jgi:hypothetical protein